jgi:hypothetical protein
MKKLVIASLLLALLPTTPASAGLFDFLLKKKTQDTREAARERLSKSKQRFLKKMEQRRKTSSLAKRFEQKKDFKARSTTARNYVKKRSAMYPAAPNR